MIKADSISKAENIANVELSKISAWAKENKTKSDSKESSIIQDREHATLCRLFPDFEIVDL
jgi:hypothetical protein